MTFGYDELSRRTSLTRPNGVSTSYTYDNLSRLLSVLHQAGGVTIDGAAYTVDNAGNRTAKTSYLDNSSEQYAYDAIYQWTQVTRNGQTSESYTYDGVGNRLSSLNLSPWTFDDSNHLLSTPSTTFTYDNNGNTLTKADTNGTTGYNWDYDNRLTSVTLPGDGGVVSFNYDPFGRRIRKSGASGTTIYAYDGANIVAEYDPAGTVLARYTQGEGIDEPLAMSRAGAFSFYDADGLGSITSLADGTGSPISTYVTDAFGNGTAATGGVTNTFRYTARESDAETGLYYYRARYYDPQLGRFLSEDPSTLEGSDVNFYLYVGNAPEDYTDPSGLCRILFNGSMIMIETNNGSQRLGPFPAKNKTICGCEIKQGVYLFDRPQWLYRNGRETPLGRQQFDAKRNRHQAFGNARIPLNVPGRSGIMIHARYPDTQDLRPTQGCVRVHNVVATTMAQFVDAVCTNDGPNSFHYFKTW